MDYTEEQLELIYDRTSGYCHICGKKLSFDNYAEPGARGAWEVEHSRPRAKGGSDRRRNPYPAHISCNRSKGTVSTRAARAWHGRTKAPLSRERREEAKDGTALMAGLAGVSVGSLVGPIGILAGALGGVYFGSRMNPDKVRPLQILAVLGIIAVGAFLLASARTASHPEPRMPSA